MKDILPPDQGRAPGLYDEQQQRELQEKRLIKERKLTIKAALFRSRRTVAGP